ncbi:hydroxymethylbutenyl pyrophosphate reductase [Caldicellulosiruptor hydrothermalis 108]|uniref:4-hydroxy-3-methylbut-2-enyl diphosphate reductase n=1 Tax=Caldicellulosiruptor hydrothermalis (strain DSM 18901 / VKM B-2411 / 108) TaxID=632292 RepID=E4QAT8_CALH1|nr:4-hydroxy-3-methylbut-2-enyl diphosphate reductase [Caldicellulosiruptor hydrothermalis]ADQ07116.1 hydroxymethylbutenyl pyrophosphate reductase [Caldicellulosiruptor hydrothermalis 108]
MIIKVAQSAGFCFGVQRAVEGVLAWAKANKGKSIKVYGMLIHNSYVIDKLKDLGVEVIEDIEQIGREDIVFIRSHGVSMEEYAEIEKRAEKVYDFTCPYVKKIHEIVKEHSENGYDIIVVGDMNHPEVKGIVGHVSNNRKCFVVDSIEKVKEAINQIEGKAAVVCQTTFDSKKWSDIREFLETHTNYKVFDTICKATINRQKEAQELAKHVDMMLVVGDKKSSNTNKLYQLLKEIKPTFFIDKVEDLDSIKLDSHIKSIGVTAGASTSPEQIEEVVKHLEEKFNEMSLKDFERFIGRNFLTVQRGEVVKGRIIKVEEDYVLVDIGYKAEGIIYKDEVIKNGNVNLKDLFKIGETIEAVVIKESDEEGNVVLSKYRADVLHGFEELLSKYENKESVRVVVKSIKEKSIVCDFRGTNVYVPISQWGEDLQTSDIGKIFEIEITDVNKEKKIAFGSRKSLLKQKEEERFIKQIESLDFSREYEGIIAEIKQKGIVVNFENLRGFVPASEVGYLKKGADLKKLFEIGEKVKVKILDIDKNKKQIYLSIKKTQDDEWIKKIKNLYLGMLVDCEVTKVLPFGLVVWITEHDVDGFVHISNIPLGYNQRPHNVYKVGDSLRAKVIEIDEEKRRVALSLKDLHEEENIDTEHNEDFVITLADFVKNIKLEQ